MDPEYAWEQMDGEPDASYARFLTFLYLRYMGHRRRSVTKAFRVHNKLRGKQQCTQTWWDDASDWCWERRADRYDVAHLRESGQRAAQVSAELYVEFVEMTRRAIRGKPLPKDMHQ